MFARLAGADSSRGALLIHGHLDVVPAEPAEWSVHPFSGAIKDGYRLGPRRGRHEGHGRHDDRGRPAVEAGRASCRHAIWCSRSWPTRNTAVSYGAQWLVDNRPDLFDGVTEAIGEVGGFSLTVPRRDGGERRLYLIETAEKGLSWMRLTARGPAGHGSMVHDQNAVTAVAEAVARLGRHRFPLGADGHRRCSSWPPSGEETGLTFDSESADLEGTIEKLGPMARMLKAVLHDTANPTMLKAGYKANVVPATAEAVIDCRILPGRKAAFEAEVDELIGPDVTREWIRDFSLV